MPLVLLKPRSLSSPHRHPLCSFNSQAVAQPFSSALARAVSFAYSPAQPRALGLSHIPPPHGLPDCEPHGAYLGAYSKAFGCAYCRAHGPTLCRADDKAQPSALGDANDEAFARAFHQRTDPEAVD